MGDDRDTGIDFGDLGDDLETEAYPLDADELLERYGDRRLEHANGSVTLRELLEERPGETYESVDEVHQAALDAVDDDAEGRAGSTDRDHTAHSEDFEQQSF